MSHATSASSARRFSLEDKAPSPSRLSVSCGGLDDGTSDDSSERGRPPYMLEFVAQGEGTLVVAGESHRLMAGMVVVHGPDTPCHVVSGPEARSAKYFVGFSGCEAAAVLEEHGLLPGTVVASQSPSRILRLFEELIRTGCGDSVFRERLVALMLEQLILVVAETAIQEPSTGAAFLSYLRCRQHIEANWSRIVTLEQLGGECGLDPAYVCRLFRRFDQLTPYQYLLRQKVNYAARRLRESEGSIKEIAKDLGFADPFHFSRVFRKVMGIPPGRYSRVASPAKRPHPNHLTGTFRHVDSCT